MDRVTQFIRFDVTAHLIVPFGEDAARHTTCAGNAGAKLLDLQSMKASIGLDATVSIGDPMEPEVPAS